jgi:hypothetical protein
VSERRKNGEGFPVAFANRQRIVGALAASGRSTARGTAQERPVKQKGRRKAGLS